MKRAILTFALLLVTTGTIWGQPKYDVGQLSNGKCLTYDKNENLIPCEKEKPAPKKEDVPWTKTTDPRCLAYNKKHGTDIPCQREASPPKNEGFTVPLSSSNFISKTIPEPKWVCNDGTLATGWGDLITFRDNDSKEIGAFCIHDIRNLLLKLLKPAVEYKPESKDEKIKRLIRELSEALGKD